MSFLTSAVIPGIGGMVGKGLPHLIHEAGEKSVTQDVGNLRVPPGAAPADNMPLSGKVSSPRRQRVSFFLPCPVCMHIALHL